MLIFIVGCISQTSEATPQTSTPIATEARPIPSASSTTFPPATASPVTVSESKSVLHVSEVYPSTDPEIIEGYTLVGRIGQSSVPNTPADTLILDDGTVLVADAGTAQIHRFDPSGNYHSSWDVPRSPGAAILRLAKDSDGRIYALTQDGRVRRFSADGILDEDWSLDWGVNSDGTPRDVGIVTGLVIDSQDHLYLAPTYSINVNDYFVVRFDPDGTLLAVWLVGRSCVAGDIAIDVEDQVIVACRDGLHSLVGDGVSEEGTTSAFWSPNDSDGAFLAPKSIAIGPNQEIAVLAGVASFENSDGSRTHPDWHILIVSPAGDILDDWTLPSPAWPHTSTPPSISFDDAGRLYFPDSNTQQISIFDAAGNPIDTRRADIPLGFTRVDRVTVDPAGNVYVFDRASRRVVKLSPDGSLLAEIPVPPLGSYANDTTGSDSLYGNLPDISIGGDGSIYLLGAYPIPSQLMQLSPDGEVINTWSNSSDDDPWVSLAIDSDGIAYLLNSIEEEISTIDTVNGVGRGPWPITLPSPSLGIWDSLWSSGDLVYISGYEPGSDENLLQTIRVFNSSGQDLGRIVAFDGDNLISERPIYGATDAAGNVYIVTQRETTEDPAERPTIEFLVRNLSPDGDLLSSGRLAGIGNTYPDIAVSQDGNRLYITDPVNRQILIYERVS